ncbi:hypothetical protein ACCO45_002375 [Purpureocillium lilacinum]|uniref:Uncharacterized protein n=1 Tax=Purpureocillium lilacinum TaxID=33203 RepID=A0ACC4E9S7_PURLI
MKVDVDLAAMTLGWGEGKPRPGCRDLVCAAAAAGLPGVEPLWHVLLLVARHHSAALAQVPGRYNRALNSMACVRSPPLVAINDDASSERLAPDSRFHSQVATFTQERIAEAPDHPGLPKWNGWLDHPALAQLSPTETFGGLVAVARALAG